MSISSTFGLGEVCTLEDLVFTMHTFGDQIRLSNVSSKERFRRQGSRWEKERR